jgi:hypothetical protein
MKMASRRKILREWHDAIPVEELVVLILGCQFFFKPFGSGGYLPSPHSTFEAAVASPAKRQKNNRLTAMGQKIPGSLK